MAQASIQHRVQVTEPPIAQFFLADTRLALIWLLIRVYTGYEWLMAGLEKFGNPVWTIVLPNAAIWSWAITLGEIAVGLGLIFGVLTGFAAFSGGLMNANYLLAGTVSTNPLLFIFATWLVLGWRVAGYYGVDRWLLPALGVPGKPGEVFTHTTSTVRAGAHAS
jgi:thiosulfate dehydrogenase [quinone] large subunit